MSTSAPTPGEARQALHEVRRQQAEAIRNSDPMPWWYVLGLGTALTGYHVLVEMNFSPLFILVATVVYVLVISALLAVVLRTRQVRWHRSLWDRTNVSILAGWVLISLVLDVAMALGLGRAGVPYPSALAAVALTVFWLLTARPMMTRLVERTAGRIEARTDVGTC